MNLSERMKLYEETFQYRVPPRQPLIIRLDGRAFHTLTRACVKPYDTAFGSLMVTTARKVVAEIQNARMAYIQSDEISVLLVDYNKFNTEQWMGGGLQKIVSVSAAVASSAFTWVWGSQAQFDSRIISLPESEVNNYFLYRQQDCVRNSIQGLAQSLYSHTELQGKHSEQLQEMIFAKGKNWNDCWTRVKRGVVVTREAIDDAIPIFSQDKTYIEKFLSVEEE